MKDRTQEYSDLYMGVNHPLANLGDSGLFAGETRGVISNMNIIQNTPTFAEISLYVTEPVILFPFEFATNANETGISQVERMTMNVQFDHLNRMWCHDFVHGSTIDSMTTTLENSFLHINYITPPNGYELPPICVLPFDEFQPIATDIGMFQPGEEKETSSTVVQFGSVPQQLYIYAKMKTSHRYSNLQKKLDQQIHSLKSVKLLLTMIIKQVFFLKHNQFNYIKHVSPMDCKIHSKSSWEK